MEKARDKEGPVVGRFERLVGEVADLYGQKTEYLRLLWKFRADRKYIFSEEYTAAVMSCHRRIREALGSIIEQGMHSGEPGEADPKRAALALLGVPDGLEAEWLENEEGPCMREVPPRGPEHRLPEPEEGGIPEGDSKEVTRRKERAA